MKRKFNTVMVKKNHQYQQNLSPQISEHKKIPLHRALEIHGHVCDSHKNVRLILLTSEKFIYDGLYKNIL